MMKLMNEDNESNTDNPNNIQVPDADNSRRTCISTIFLVTQKSPDHGKKYDVEFSNGLFNITTILRDFLTLQKFSKDTCKCFRCPCSKEN